MVSCFQTSSSASSLKMRTRIGECFGIFFCRNSESSSGGSSFVALVRQLIAVFAKARDRRQCRGKSRRQHKRTDYRGADHCYTPDVEPFLSECL